MAKKPPGDYPVGYGKTPEHTRFQKGQSGNPSGRPKGTLSLAAVLRRALKEKIWVTENGERSCISKFDAAVIQMVNKAVKGETRAMQQVLSFNGLLSETAPALTPAVVAESEQRALATLLQRLHADRADTDPPPPASAGAPPTPKGE